MRWLLLVVAVLFVASCNTNQPKADNKKPAAPKGELAFLLQYNGRMPSDVGFATNHIVERRLANLMKENFQPFRDSLGTEYPLVVDTVNYIVKAHYGGKLIHQEIVIDVANDAFWVDYMRPDTTLHFADNSTLMRPA
ncbi:MAG TPA: hypothetical protein PLW44_12905 [Chitinophagales bacterium]|nr:hypothetical protein [Chitinophagales bacterium]